MMYSYGLLYLLVPTYSIICSTQLAFNVIVSFLINLQKLMALIVNSLVILTFSASLVAIHNDSDDSLRTSQGSM